MHNITNYSIFYVIELKFRLFYFFISLFINSIYTLVYITDFLVQFLQPIEYLNMDLNMDSLCNFLLFNMSTIINIEPTLHSNTIVSEVVFDYYPVFEINMTNNNSVYLGFFIYLNIIYLLPIFFYHFYLFITPGLYKYEYVYITSVLVMYLSICLLYINKIHNLVLLLVLYFTYNNFYEYLNYEFDIDFNLLEYITTNIILITLFNVNILLIFLLLNYSYNNILYIIFISMNIILFVNIIIFIFYISILYLTIYIRHLFILKHIHIKKTITIL